GDRRAARDHRLQLAPAGYASTVRVEDLPQGRAHRQLVRARSFDVSADAVELRPRPFFRADGFEPVGAAADDVRHAGEGLDVVDDRRRAEDAVGRGERRLDPRVRALALERLDQAGLFAADVGPGAAMHDDVELEAGAEDVAEIALGVGLLD